MFTTATYDPRSVDLYIAGIAVDAFADGTFISMKYAADKNKVVSGAKGDQTIVKINNGSGDVTFRLKQNSAMHAYLTDFTLGDDATTGGLPALPFLAMQGSTPLAEGMCKVGKAPNRDFPGSATGSDEPICEWNLVLTNFRLLS